MTSALDMQLPVFHAHDSAVLHRGLRHSHGAAGWLARPDVGWASPRASWGPPPTVTPLHAAAWASAAWTAGRQAGPCRGMLKGSAQSPGWGRALVRALLAMLRGRCRRGWALPALTPGLALRGALHHPHSLPSSSLPACCPLAHSVLLAAPGLQRKAMCWKEGAAVLRAGTGACRVTELAGRHSACGTGAATRWSEGSRPTGLWLPTPPQKVTVRQDHQLTPWLAQPAQPCRLGVSAMLPAGPSPLLSRLSICDTAQGEASACCHPSSPRSAGFTLRRRNQGRGALGGRARRNINQRALSNAGTGSERYRIAALASAGVQGVVCALGRDTTVSVSAVGRRGTARRALRPGAPRTEQGIQNR